jgi:hypothetical protein
VWGGVWVCGCGWGGGGVGVGVGVCVYVGLLLGATGIFPNESNTVGLYASTSVDTFFISRAAMKENPETHLVLLSVALASTSCELSVCRRKIVQLRQHYPIPAFDKHGHLKTCVETPKKVGVSSQERYGVLDMPGRYHQGTFDDGLVIKQGISCLNPKKAPVSSSPPVSVSKGKYCC